MKMKKIIGSFLLAGLIMQLMSPIAFAAGSNADRVVGQGLFTKSDIKIDDTCYDKDQLGDKTFTKEDAKKAIVGDATEGENQEGGKGGNLLSKMMNGIVKGFESIFAVDCTNSNFIGDLAKITTPVNLTNNPVIMSLMGVTQWIALGSSVIFISVFGIMYSLGFEKIDPIKFGIRIFVAMLATYFLPYLIQDVININNMLVHYISTMPIAGNTGMALATMFSYIIGKVAVSILGATVGSGGSLGLVAAGVIIGLIVYLIVQILRIIIWWYMRMLMIFVLSVLGPFFVMMMALPQTAKMSKTWTKALIGEIFQQLVFTLGLYFFISLFLNISLFQSAVDIGPFGKMFLFYAGMLFLVKMPELSKGLIGGASFSAGKDAMAAAAAAGAAMGSLGNRGMQAWQEGRAKKDFDDQIGEQGKKVEEKSGNSLQTAMANVKGQEFQAEGDQQFRVGADGQMEMLLGDELKGKEFNPFNNVDENSLSDIIGGNMTREGAIDGLQSELMLANPDRYDGGNNEALAKADAENFMQALEKENSMSFGAQKQIENLQRSGDLDESKFREIMRQDVAQNPDIYEGKNSGQVINDLMDHKGWNEVVNDKSPRKNTTLNDAPKIQVGDVHLNGGKRNFNDNDVKQGKDFTKSARQEINHTEFNNDSTSRNASVKETGGGHGGNSSPRQTMSDAEFFGGKERMEAESRIGTNVSGMNLDQVKAVADLKESGNLTRETLKDAIQKHDEPHEKYGESGSFEERSRRNNWDSLINGSEKKDNKPKKKDDDNGQMNLFDF